MKNLYLSLLLLFATGMVMAQKPLTNSRINSYYTYIFQVKDADIELLYNNNKYLLHDDILTRPIDSALTAGFKMPLLKPGNYLRVYAEENKLQYKLIENHTVFLKILDNRTDLRFTLMDTDGKTVSNAQIWLKNSRINFEPKAGMYVHGNVKNGTLLKVKYAGVTNYFAIGEKKPYQYHPTVWRWFYNAPQWTPLWRKVVFYTPLRYISNPIARLFQAKGYYNDRYNNYSSAYAGYMAFNKPMYKPGDTVKFKAYIFTKRSQKPVKQKQLLLKIKESYTKEAKTIGMISSYRDGAFEGRIVLNDSLKLTLDRDCILSLELPSEKKEIDDDDEDEKTAKEKILMAAQFRYEEYELKAIKFLVRADKQSHSPGDPVSLYFKATDENDLPVADGRVELTLTTNAVNQYNNRHAFVPDTLWGHKLILDAVGETKLQIPDSIFAKAEIRYTVHSVFLNSNNESQTRDNQLTFKDEPYQIITKIDQDTIKINYRVHGKDVPAKATIYAANQVERPAKTRLQLPAKFVVNPNIPAYAIETDSAKTVFDLGSVNADLTSVAYRNADSVFITVNNPRHLHFWYTVFNGDQIMDTGEGVELSYKKAYHHNGNVFFLLNWIWGGEARHDESIIIYRDKLLDISVKQPVAVYPGQQVEMEIDVKDAVGRPVANADLTAYSFTSKFQRQNNVDVPYFGKLYPARQAKHTYRVDDQNIDSYLNLNWQRWGHQMGLDSIEYFKFTHPANIYRLEEPAPDSLTQVAPFVMYKGGIQPVYIVYIDDKPIYFNQAEQLQRYSFSVRPGRHKINMRTATQSILLNEVNIPKGKKLILSINADTMVNKSVIAVKMPSVLTPYEAAQLNRYMITVIDNFGWKNATLTYNDQVLLLPHKATNYSFNYSTYDSPNVKLLVGPLPSDYVDFTLHGEAPRPFLFEPGYSFEFLPGLIKQKSISQKFPFDVSLGKSTMPAYNQYTLTRKEVDTIWRSYLDQRSYSTQIFPREYIPPYHNGKLVIGVEGYGDNNTPGPGQPLIKNIIVYRNDNVDYMRIYPGNTTNLEYLQPGTYRLLFLLRGDSYHLQEHVVVKANGTNYYKITLKSKPQDAVSYKIAQIIDNRSGLYDNNNQDILRLKEAFNDTYLDRSTFTGKMTGVILSQEDGQPLPGVSIKVKGTSTGTATDVYGHFTIAVPTQGTLIVAYVGYKTQEITISSGTFITIKLQADSKSLNEVVVTGYGTTRRMDMTGSVSTIISNELQGKLAGVMVRGTGSIATANAPLYVIDGIPVEGGMAGLDPSLIADMSVLKDAAATAVYGAKGVNGVVIITTKKKPGTNTNDGSTPGQQQTLRSRFSDYAYWQPRLTTDANGKARFTVTFPDDITKWRTGVIGVAGKQTGFAQGQIKSFKVLSANFVSPQFAVQGDELNPIGKVMNYGTDAVNVNRSFKYNGQVIKQGSLTIKSSLIDTFKVVAVGADSLHFEYTVKKDNGYFDGERRSIPVFEQGVLETKGTFANLEKDTTLTLKFDPKLGPVTFRAEASALPVLVDETERLRNYEYLCNEQLASKLKALLIQKRIKKYLGEPFKWDKNVNLLIKKLQESRRAGGIWGWWKDSEEELWISLHAVEALVEAGQQGYTVQLDKQKLIDYLVYRANAYTSTNKLDAISLLIKLGGKADYAQLLSSYQKQIPKKDKLSAYEKMRVMLVRQQAGLPVVLDSLARYQHSTMFGNLYWGQSCYAFFDNSIQLSVMAYHIYKNEGGHVSMLPKIRNYFLEQRGSAGWRNTYESSLILETILPDLLSADKAPRPSSITLSGDKTETVSNFPYTTTMAAGSKLTIAKKGDLPVYITGYQQFWNRHPEKVSKDFTVTTHFVKNSEKVTRLKGGEAVTLEASVTARADADFVMIEIPIPAGCSYDSKYQNYWGNEVHREYFKNKVSIFCRKLKQGNYSFSIKLMPRYSGTYTLNPAKAEMMYFPVFYGREELKKVSIN